MNLFSIIIRCVQSTEWERLGPARRGGNMGELLFLFNNGDEFFSSPLRESYFVPFNNQRNSILHVKVILVLSAVTG